MNVLGTTQPVGEQVEVGGASKFTTVTAGGANAAGAQKTVAGVNPGSGLTTFTLSGAPLTPSASGIYLVTAEAFLALSAAGGVQLEILLDTVAQPIATPNLIVNATAGAVVLSVDWTDLITASLNAAHTWALRVTAVGGPTISAGAGAKLVVLELG